MNANIPTYQKRLLWLTVVQNLLLAGAAAFLMLKFGDLRIGSLSDEHFTGYDNIMMYYIGTAIIFMPLEAAVLKLPVKPDRADYVKKIKDSLFTMMAEGLFLLAVSVFNIVRYGESALYDVADGQAFAGGEGLFNLTMLPFMAIGVIELIICAVCFFKIKREED